MNLLPSDPVFVVSTAKAIRDGEEREWVKSRFPHPLLTVDYDKDGNVLQVVAVGVLAQRLIEETNRALDRIIVEVVVSPGDEPR